MGTPNSAAPRNDYGNYGYGSAGKPISSVDYGRIDDRGKPLHRGSAGTDDHDEKPAIKPEAPQRTKPSKPPQRTKPAPQRTKPAQADDTRPDPPSR
ncbi:MAG: hypothetical protein IAG13_34910, partial [Deltaproteobacteria bacterium]|nr:hypothetical protein [Nannocystaceae bacterium]